MVTGDLKLDILILEVFEEHEETFFWPLDSQKEAKSFIKFLHEKGFLYEDMCKEIGEFEHNFRAWRKGLGRVGIGTRLMDRINRTVEDVIASDDEEDTEHNLKLLAKVNDKKTKEKPRETLPANPKQQKQDITSSMMKNIDKVSTQINGTSNSKPETRNTQVTVKDTTPISNNPPRTTVDSKKEVPVVIPAAKKEPTKPEPSRIEPKPVPVVEEHVSVVKTQKVESKQPEKVVVKTPKEKVESRQPEKVVVQTTQPEENKVQQSTRVERTQHQDKAPVVEAKKEEKVSEEKPDDPEVDEVKRKMEAIRKKVELMKKAKAEAAAAAVASQTTNTSNVNPPVTEAGEKYDAMKKRLGELRSKLMEDESQTVSLSTMMREQKQEEDNTGYQQQPQHYDRQRSNQQETHLEVPAPAPIVKAEDDSDEVLTEESDLEDEVDINETNPYISDLDPENYDSDLEYEIYREVKTLALKTDSMLVKTRKLRDGPGHVYVFSDSPSNDREHRVKIGCSRSPEKKFQEARKYNIAIKQVSSTPVNKRNSALKSVLRSLESYRISTESDWFKGPIDVILQKLSAVTEKYGTGPSLVSFDSRC